MHQGMWNKFVCAHIVALSYCGERQMATIQLYGDEAASWRGAIELASLIDPDVQVVTCINEIGEATTMSRVDSGIGPKQWGFAHEAAHEKPTGIDWDNRRASPRSSR